MRTRFELDNAPVSSVSNHYTIADVQPGDIFQYWDDDESDWYEHFFLMLEPELNKSGQVWDLTEGVYTFFTNPDEECKVRIFTRAAFAHPRISD